MEKDRFLSLVQNYTSLSEAEAVELDNLQQAFPFSQVIHNLATRAAQDNHLPTHKHLLGISAIYSTDRSVLKDIMTEPRTERKAWTAPAAEQPGVVSIVEPTKEESITIPSLQPFVGSSLSGDNLIEEINSDLNQLRVSRHNFELSLQEFENAQLHPTPLPDPVIPQEELEENEHLEGLIEHIKSKKEIDPEGDRQKEQFQIIDQFIKKSPAIARGKAHTMHDDDLAEKSAAFGDHIISETLVDILLKQGKKDKAIEVLRKLIWKFPQKKAIFAAQIEILRK